MSIFKNTFFLCVVVLCTDRIYFSSSKVVRLDSSDDQQVPSNDANQRRNANVTRPRVKILEGELEGTVEVSLEGNEYYSFKGIPYAEPPIGELRFKPPVPKKPWSEVRDASQEGDYCAQFQYFLKTFSGSENCLFLNVFTRRIPLAGKENGVFPVMLYIHSGGFVFGSGNVDEFGPDFIVAEDTVLVTINYRLGVLGFLCLDTPEAPGNVGLRDQTLAMKWVQQNIRAFNGDPDNVTIFGISAGSASVEYHLLSPMSKGLFHKAILQSGSTLNPWARTRDPSKLVKRLSKRLGIAKEDPAKLVEDLRESKVEVLVNAAYDALDIKNNIKAAEMFSFTPVVEKTLPDLEPFLNQEPLELLSSGKFARVPTISGFCENEGALFKPKYAGHLESLKKGRYVDFLPPSFEVDRIYFDTRLREMYDQWVDPVAVDTFLSDLNFVAGIHQSLSRRLRSNHSENYFYNFVYDGRLNFLKLVMNSTERGAFHGDDTTYLASNAIVKDITPAARDILVRRRMVKMWTDFAKTGRPTLEKSDLVSIEWLPVTSEQALTMEIGKDLKMKTTPFLEKMTLWESLYNSSAGH